MLHLSNKTAKYNKDLTKSWINHESYVTILRYSCSVVLQYINNLFHLFYYLNTRLCFKILHSYYLLVIWIISVAVVFTVFFKITPKTKLCTTSFPFFFFALLCFSFRMCVFSFLILLNRSFRGIHYRLNKPWYLRIWNLACIVLKRFFDGFINLKGH